MTNGELMISTIESVMGVEFDKSFDWRELNSHEVVIVFDGSWWVKENTITDIVKQCDVVKSCEDCPRYGDDCNGEVDDE